LGGKRCEKGAERTTAAANIVPIETESKNAKSFITRRAAENAGKPGTVTLREAEDTDSCECWRNEFWEPFPDEDAYETRPEEAHALFL
jgi:hypothetical protein